MNTFDRPQANGFGGIPTINSKVIRDYCRDFGFSELDYKKVLAIEQSFKECMIEKQEHKKNKEKNHEEFQKKMNMPQQRKKRR